ncbi:MAG: glycosyltransferase [Armatimonadetes bacterium]|nr:glycosyltransferase [Armatimonadota bacterium]
MKLLYVSTLDHIIRAMLPHLQGAKDAGYRVEVACRVTRFGDDVRAVADAVHDVPMERFPLHTNNLRALKQVTELIRRERYDVVHSHNPSGGFIGRLAATNAGTGALRVYTAHGFHFHRHGHPAANAVYETIERYAGHKLSDAVYTYNREDYDAALLKNIVPEPRLFATRGIGISARDRFNPGAVAVEERAAFRAEIGADADTPILSVVGEMLPRKRQFDAIGAMPRLLTKHPKALLVLVGDGKMLARNEALARRLGVAANCRFLGFRRDVRTILAASDLFVFPSQQEGLPCAIQEALAMRVPVVATDVRGNCEIVSDATGRLVPLANPDALADAAIELLSLPKTARDALGATGRDNMITHYEREKCVQEWLDNYKVADARRRGQA